MEKIRYRGKIKSHNNKMFFLDFLNLDTNEIIKKKFYLKNEYINEFLYKKYKSAHIEFTAIPFQEENVNYIKNINNITTNNFYYSEEERRVILKDFDEEIFIATYTSYSINKGCTRKNFLFNNIKLLNGTFISDHCFLEFIENEKKLIKGVEYIFKAKIKKYRKGYSNLDFYGFYPLHSNQISEYKGKLIENTNIYKKLYYKYNNHSLTLKGLFIKKSKRFLFFSNIMLDKSKIDFEVKNEDFFILKNTMLLPFELIHMHQYVFNITLNYKIVINSGVNELTYYVSNINEIYLNNNFFNKGKSGSKFLDCQDAIFFNPLNGTKDNFLINLTTSEKVKKGKFYKEFSKKLDGVQYFSANIEQGRFINFKVLPNL